VNRIGRPFGILTFPTAYERPYAARGKRQAVFERIFAENAWSSRESVSGPGSELKRTARYRSALISFLKRYEIRRFFDAPCGDLNWMGAVLAEVPLDYCGGDISEAVLEVARKRHPDLNLSHFDICKDRFPNADVWQCRDTFLHLSFEDIWSALSNASKADIRYALITTHRARWLKNLDIVTGGHRPIDLRRAPFNFPRPVEYLDDSAWGEFPRAVGVWPMAVIREIVARGPAKTA
jgi:SAM-dependent methyltransferase